MAEFRTIVERSTLPIAQTRGRTRDLTVLQPYIDYVQSVIDEGPDKAGQIALAPEEKKTERSRVRSAATQLGVAVRIRFQNGDSELVFWIDPEGKVPQKGGWKTEARTTYTQARKLGLPTKEYRALLAEGHTFESLKAARDEEAATGELSNGHVAPAEAGEEPVAAGGGRRGRR